MGITNGTGQNPRADITIIVSPDIGRSVNSAGQSRGLFSVAL